MSSDLRVFRGFGSGLMVITLNPKPMWARAWVAGMFLKGCLECGNIGPGFPA